MVIMTRHVNIFQSKHFSTVKLDVSYKKKKNTQDGLSCEMPQSQIAKAVERIRLGPLP